MVSSQINQDTIDAYMATEFQSSDRSLVMRVGEVCEELSAAFTQFAVSSAAFVTAMNPYSKIVSDDQNAAAHDSLIKTLESAQIPFFGAFGVDPSGRWPSEEGVIAFGLDLEAAIIFGTDFEQNAIVWVGKDCVPQLVLLR